MRLVPTSLTGRLVATVVALVALSGVLVATATSLAMRGYLTDQLDARVLAAAERGSRPIFGSPGLGLPPDELDDGRGGEGPGEARGQGVGTLTAIFEGSAQDGVVITDGSRDSAPALRAISSTGLAALAEVPPDGDVHTVDLPALGEYRVTAVERSAVTVVVGLPTGEIDDVLGSLVGWEVLLTLLGVAAAATVGLVVVRRQLRPLREVAATAHEVAALPLETGEIGTTVRVPDGLTDPRTEVGQVGVALNTLLAHMESALDARHRSEQQVRQFVADASHELRTPLTTIQGYAELARRTAPKQPDDDQGRGRGTPDDGPGRGPAAPGPPRRRPSAGPRGGRPDPPRARGGGRCPGHRPRPPLGAGPAGRSRSPPLGDEQRLHQLLTNLIGNARRHTPERHHRHGRPPP